LHCPKKKQTRLRPAGNASLMIFFCKIIEFLPTRQLALSLKMFTKHFLYALSYHPDRLLPTLFPATRLFGLLRRPTLKK